MPYMKKDPKTGKSVRDYKRENALYNSRPENVKKREERNRARRELTKEGKVHKGDGLDVDHKKPLSKGGKTIPSNLRAVPASENRSFRRNAKGQLVSQRSRREYTRKK